MKRFLCAVLGVLLFTSCKDESDFIVENNFHNEEQTYAIPADVALAYLKDFMDCIDNPDTRSSDKRIVSSVTPIKYQSLPTRTKEDINCDNLLYIANFEQDEGFAILAADNRIEEKIMVIADRGNLSDKTIYEALEINNTERIIVDGYPKTGPGFFTTPETGDEIFMNPNTVSLYDETEQDTLVGNFSLDEDVTTRSITNTPAPELVVSSLCVSYAVNRIRDYENKLQHLQIVKEETIEGGGSGGHGNSGAPLKRTETTTSPWVIKDIVSPILTNYVAWDQDKPFNNLYPAKRKWLFFGHKRNAPAGCFPLAISKILTHFEAPKIFIYNGYLVNWKELKQSHNSTIGRSSAAHLLKGISTGCGSWYFYEGTFTFPNKATSYMRNIGIANAHSYSYSFERVKKMIDKECPLIIYSVPGINIFKSHSWNIDGYKIKERTVTTKTYSGSTLENTTTKTETYYMVHCDFGWKGDYNGYYVSGIFKLNDANIEYDNKYQKVEDETNYNNLLRVIMYDKPNVQ